MVEVLELNCPLAPSPNVLDLKIPGVHRLLRFRVFVCRREAAPRNIGPTAVSTRSLARVVPPPLSEFDLFDRFHPRRLLNCD